MRFALFAAALAVCLPSGASAQVSPERALPVLKCLGPKAMDPYFITFDLDGRKAYVQRDLGIPPREAFPIDVLSRSSIEWTGIMKFKFDRRKNLLHETAIISTDDYQCSPMKAEKP